MAKDEKKKIQATDPLEAAKIATKPPPPKPSAPPPPPVTFDSKPDAPMEVASSSSAKKYRVKKTTTISLAGNITKLNEGDVVSESSYGPDHMKRILEANVPLEEV
jgi:hypothetical protein